MWRSGRVGPRRVEALFHDQGFALDARAFQLRRELGFGDDLRDSVADTAQLLIHRKKHSPSTFVEVAP